ncbi:hypothetical protein PRUB_a4310 [Pseudoalteromonas rubra]|uniref:Uncharacterized protein n=1 Tax=Pseudoalteromonas rubra TaxID=43658 RepID=A0A8T0C4G7_9GAMM|nr:hypothetical protein [Pseudoalteromonas rubra]KAF7785604.1 hypothetical protein PRUB_a4310 [Pseudoalteromonas rubra]
MFNLKVLSGSLLLAAGLSASCFASANEKPGIFFKSQGQEVRVIFSESSRTGQISTIKFIYDCNRSDNCITSSFHDRLYYDFAAAMKYKRFYKYVMLVVDPCFDNPSCIPHKVDPITLEEDNSLYESAVDLSDGEDQIQRVIRRPNRQPDDPAIANKFLEGLAGAIGSEGVKQLADLMKDKSKKSTNQGGVQFYGMNLKRVGNQNVPQSLCRLEGSYCTDIDAVRFDHLPGGRVLVEYDHGDGRGEYREREDAMQDMFDELDYQCRFTYTGVLPNLTAQVTCYFRP